MKLRALATLAPVTAGLIFWFSQGTAIHAADGDTAGAIQFYASNGMKHPVEGVSAGAEKAIGHPVSLHFGGALGLSDTLANKAVPFDVAILTPVALDQLEKAGKIVPGSRSVVARVGIGIAMRGSGPKPDVSTPEKFKAALLAPTTKSVRWAGPTGAATPTVEAAIAKLGIGDAIKDKVHTSGPAVVLAAGEIEIRFDLNSEVLPGTMLAKDDQYLGQLPGNLAAFVVMESAISKTSSDPKAAKALVDYLKGPALDPGLKAVGMIR